MLDVPHSCPCQPACVSAGGMLCCAILPVAAPSCRLLPGTYLLMHACMAAMYIRASDRLVLRSMNSIVIFTVDRHARA